MNLTAIRWQDFRARAEAVEKRSPFEPYSIPIYALLLMAGAAEASVVYANDLWFSSYDPRFSVSPLLLMTAFLARRYAMPRAAAVIEGLTLLAMLAGVTWLGTVLAAKVSAPFADHLLIRADRMMGFEWLDLLAVYQAHPWMVDISREAYTSPNVQTFLVPAITFAMGMRGRGWALLNAWAAASLIVVAVFPFVPAVGPYVYYGLPKDALPGQVWNWPWVFGPTIEALRSGEMRDLASAMEGLVSFPSFHTATGVLFAWAMWPLRWLRWPFVALNAAMIFSAIVRGSHYLIDILGGIVVAIVAIWIATWLIKACERMRPSADHARNNDPEHS